MKKGVIRTAPSTVRLSSCLEPSGVQATPRNARIDVEDVDHVTATIGWSAVLVLRPKSAHAGRALYRRCSSIQQAADTFLNMAREASVNVRLGSWPCKNAAPSKSQRNVFPLEARSASVRSILNCGAAASEKQILCRSRDFTFSHSQGQTATSAHFRLRSALHPAADISTRLSGAPRSPD